MLFHEFIFRPLFNILVFLYNTVAFKDLGVAIILLTIVIRFILFPLFYKSFKNQSIIQRLQPKIKKIQHDHKENKEEQAKKIMQLYKEHKINPFSGILLLLVQLPVLIALYRVFLADIGAIATENLYAFIKAPGIINNTFLHLINLTERDMIIVALAVVAQYIQGKMALGRQVGNSEGAAGKMGRQMVFLGPILTLVILPQLPAAVGLYWLTSAIFSIAQQEVINKSIDKQEEHGTLSGTNQKTRESSGAQ